MYCKFKYLSSLSTCVIAGKEEKHVGKRRNYDDTELFKAKEAPLSCDISLKRPLGGLSR